MVEKKIYFTLQKLNKFINELKKNFFRGIFIGTAQELQDALDNDELTEGMLAIIIDDDEGK